MQSQSAQITLEELSAEQQAHLDQVLDALSAKKDDWAQLPISDYIQIIDEILELMPSSEEDWLKSGLELAEGQRGSSVESEAWFNLSVVYRILKSLRRSLARLEQGQFPFPPKNLRRSENGYLKAKVVPSSLFERIALAGIKASVWLDENNSAQASAYHQQNRKGALCVVFGGGNAAAVVPVDFLHKLFVERQVVLLKSNPVNENLIPALEIAFAPLISLGYLKLVPGDKAEGGYLAHHPGVDELHITGSDRTYEAIIFGNGSEGQRRKKEKKPIISKRFTAELGNISPVIIVPGPWNDADISYQSRKIGSWLIPNAGHNCLTPRVLIQHRDWDQREKLNQSISAFLDRNDTRKAYYPGSERIHSDFLTAHPDALQLGRQKKGNLPWTFIRDLDADARKEICFTREAFIGLFSEASLKAETVPEYIREAVRFANEKLWGTLTASIVIHPKSLEDPEVSQAVEEAIRDLKYGSITVNHWGALAYYMGSTPWGGAPGHDIYDIQSGMGWVNNPYMFDAPIKSVVRAPFRQDPDPFMADAKNSYPYFVRDTRFQANPNVLNLVRLLWAAVRS